jgi:hypothetical protein
MELSWAKGLGLFSLIENKVLVSFKLGILRIDSVPCLLSNPVDYYSCWASPIVDYYTNRF